MTSEDKMEAVNKAKPARDTEQYYVMMSECKIDRGWERPNQHGRLNSHYEITFEDKMDAGKGNIGMED